MKFYFKQEMRRALYSKNMIIAIVLSCICMFSGILLGNFYVEKKDAVYYFMLAHSLGRTSLLSLLGPVIVSLPFAASFLEDKDSGFLKLILLKISRKKYLLTRIISNAIAGALSITVPLIIVFIFYSLIYGVKTGGMAAGKYAGDLDWLSVNKPVLFVIVILVLSFIFGIVISTLGLGLSTVIKSKYLTIILPFLFSIFTGTVFQYFGINKIFDFELAGLFDFNLTGLVNLRHILLYDSILCLLGILLFVNFSRGKNGDKIE
ncbi:hypothetical protein [Clostridium manihotivorum]|uniref:ABC-2 family transporter protein n=1 Tax=Clostridium manihotivorum TaxID=2320868 RepID=A0A410DUZ5_9CLOT|nr:hypothetical protein [Clostridium manihotivorum]QAA32901.1 hypothetical protein C1I91_15340 [Clostridium manihotivorum]